MSKPALRLIWAATRTSSFLDRVKSLTLLPLPSGLQLSREQDTYQDMRLDELGYLHLTTTVPYLYHMGNAVDPEIVPEVNKLRRMVPASAPVKSKVHRKATLAGNCW